MSSQAVKDFLTKQLVIENNIVTYRSLSRELAIHVNVAKNELAAYHINSASQSRSSAATYLLSGEVRSPERCYDVENSMDVDIVYDGDLSLDGDEGDDGEDVPQTQIMLVGERDLEGAKSKFTRLHTTHIYCLSPSPIRDAGLLCGPTQIVREADQKKGHEMAIIVGKVVGAHIQMKEDPHTRLGKMAPPVAGPSKMNPIVKRAPSLKVRAEVDDNTKEKDNSDENERTKTVMEKPKEKSKATGKLDFSKAKKKETKKDESKEARVEQKKKDLAKLPSTSNVKSEKVAEKVEAKRGTKRKSISTLLSDSEDASESSSATRSKPPSKPKPGHRVAKGVVYSDDEDDVPQTLRRKGRVSSRITSDLDSEAEKNVQAMMDVDDDQVVRVSRGTSNAREKEEEEEGSEDEDVTMADDLAQKPKPKKRKQKKVIPLGHNGLKKKRVVKSRTTVDAKGYMATEDYSSYESVEEEEPETTATMKGKAKAKSAKKPADDNDSASPDPPKTKPVSSEKSLPTKGGTKSSKPSAGSSKVVRQNSLANFFGPGPPKAKK